MSRYSSNIHSAHVLQNAIAHVVDIELRTRHSHNGIKIFMNLQSYSYAPPNSHKIFMIHTIIRMFRHQKKFYPIVEHKAHQTNPDLKYQKNINLILILLFIIQPFNNSCKGAFNNYVDKMRGEGVKKVCFCPRSGYKNCPRRGGSKKGKISC